MKMMLHKTAIVCVLLLGVSLAQDIDIWDQEQDIQSTVDKEDRLLAELCNNINLIVYDKATRRQFDCAIKEWELEEQDRIIRKREVAEEEPTEGSGEEPIIQPDDAKESGAADTKTEDAPKEEQPENAKPVEEQPQTEEKPEEQKEPDSDINTKSVAVEEKQASEETPTEAPKEEATEAPEVTNEEQPKVDVPSAPEAGEEQPKTQDLIPIVTKVLNLLPQPNADENTDAFQDANTVMENHPEIDGNSKSAPIQLAGPRSMQENTPLKADAPSEPHDTPPEAPETRAKEQDNTDVPKTGESAKATKDSNILIMMFVGVVVVGVAAFGYNYVRKRTQGVALVTDDVEAAEKTAKTEQEMHPLMNGKEEKQHPHDQEQVYKPTTSALN